MTLRWMGDEMVEHSTYTDTDGNSITVTWGDDVAIESDQPGSTMLPYSIAKLFAVDLLNWVLFGPNDEDEEGEEDEQDESEV